MNAAEWASWGVKKVGGKRLNLDALIRREDLQIASAGSGKAGGQGGIPVSELAENRLHYRLLRKPAFQRVTNDWDVDNVVTLIKSFRDGQLIPALILWQSQAGYSFVIDGAHRLSAFIAWVNEDYGAGPISRRFFEDRIPRQQQDYAEECRRRIAIEVGTYADLSASLQEDRPTPEKIRWASNISKPLDSQWVAGDSETAESSFLTINKRAVVISDTEKSMIIARNKPNVIAARALARAATGYEYWSKFGSDAQESIKRKARNIYDVLFEPEIADLSRSVELPVAGRPYSQDALRISLALINFAGDIRVELKDDLDGTHTIRLLDQAHGVVKYIAGHGRSSLGLHPSVYFWGATGRHHPSAFLAMVSFIKYLNAFDKMLSFCFHRAAFEEFLVTNQQVVKHILGKYGGWEKSAPSVFEMYKIIFTGIESGGQEGNILKRLISDHRFQGLSEAVELRDSANKKIGRETKQAVRRRKLLQAALRCPLCHARLPSTAFSDDHIVRVQDGGRGNERNVQLTHPFCNHGFKEYLTSSGKSPPPTPSFLK